MDERRKKQVAAVAVLAVLAYGLHAFINRPKTNEEALIRGVVQAMATAVENGRYKDFTVHLAEDYKDNRGHPNKAAAANTIRTLCARFALKTRLTVSIASPITVELAPSRQQATVRMSFSAWERKASTPRTVDVIPGNARSFTFDLDMVLADGRWLVREATQIRK